ncbi:MAG: GIY-YIG nuclease family protein [Sphingomonadaceae bacterium]|nr:GIY-YIG nuclease family protein [Sphingomonadaceae bacterium]
MLKLVEPVAFTRGKLAATLPPGTYIYAGSANGPGGMRARLRRHFRKDKALRWHVDELSVRASSMAALAIEGGSECAIVEALLASGRFTIPLPGFGSSDCKACAAHLLAYKE